MEVPLKSPCPFCGLGAHCNMGTWTEEEDMRLITAVYFYGESEWTYKPTAACIRRCGLSCQHHWFNHIRPDIINADNFSQEEEEKMIMLFGMFGNNWSAIAGLMAARSARWIRNRCLAAIVRRSIVLNGTVVARGHQERWLQQVRQPAGDLNLDLRLRPPSPPKQN